ncbi:MAG: hypothetical protein M3Y34_08710 [Actinomycetota bacterium]|nr:hypothetical protein [Actinomycetota bacterium]
MRERDGHSTFAIGLRVGEDGDLRFAVGEAVIEILLTADDEPWALREVRILEVDDADLVPWAAQKPDQP